MISIHPLPIDMNILSFAGSADGIFLRHLLWMIFPSLWPQLCFIYELRPVFVVSAQLNRVLSFELRLRNTTCLPVCIAKMIEMIPLWGQAVSLFQAISLPCHTAPACNTPSPENLRNSLNVTQRHCFLNIGNGDNQDCDGLPTNIQIIQCTASSGLSASASANASSAASIVPSLMMPTFRQLTASDGLNLPLIGGDSLQILLTIPQKITLNLQTAHALCFADLQPGFERPF